MVPPAAWRPPLQGALVASDQPFARNEQSAGLFVSRLTPEGAIQPDRETRIGLDALTPLHPLVACGDLSPQGRILRFLGRGWREAPWID